jgi:hypothetical protein
MNCCERAFLVLLLFLTQQKYRSFFYMQINREKNHGSNIIFFVHKWLESKKQGGANTLPGVLPLLNPHYVRGATQYLVTLGSG